MDRLDKYIEDKEKNYLHPSEIANILKEISDEQFDYYITKLPREILGDVTLALPNRYLDDIVEAVPVKDLSVGVEELESDDQTDLIQDIEEIDIHAAKEVFDSLDKDSQDEIRKLRKFDENQAGAYMQTETFVGNIDEQVHSAIERFKYLKEQNEIENVHAIFITRTDGKLLYSIDLEDILTFDFTQTFKTVIEAHEADFVPIFASDTENIYEVIKTFDEYDLSVMPIVDHFGTLVGRITSDDVHDIINQQATEQLYNLAGVDDEAEEDENIYEAGKKRGLWLCLNLLTAIIASIVIGLFEETLRSYVALAILMPIIASMGGNAGTQSLTVVVRQLALGENSLKDAFRIIKKEVLISLGNGLAFAAVMGMVASLWFDKGMLGVVIACSMVTNLFVAGFFGAAVPLFLKRLRIDPAIGSSVLLTTVTDVVGFFSFLWLADLLLS
ncbi:MAG: magnesium transporter [Nitrospiria bacterium]